MPAGLTFAEPLHEPLQVGEILEITAVGWSKRTFSVAFAVHPFALVTVTVYVIVDVGKAVTLDAVVELKPDAGVHDHEVAPAVVGLSNTPEVP